MCVCVLYVHAAGSSRRGGAQIGQVFFFVFFFFLVGGVTLETSRTHIHSPQLHMTESRPEDS